MHPMHRRGKDACWFACARKSERKRDPNQTKHVFTKKSTEKRTTGRKRID